ncbi:cell wall-active antibiotics response protein LiaF [Halobacillus salinus]|uniref:cell wall-active antibiotics response protein LiaF n=1 Tax=Halobacillus salinus TaxID=192814 RepID=UPI001C3755F9|nr:cell wall-active antibiotics response protein LiaF [Halobacillus salinus]
MKRGFFNIMMAIGFVMLGVVLLLSNFNMVSFNYPFNWEYIYPIILLGIGLKMWFDAVTTHGGSWVIGSFLTLVGTLLLLDRFEILLFTFSDIPVLWPIISVYIGVHLFLRGSQKNGPRRNKKKKNRSSFAVGDISYKQDNWKVEPMNISMGIGDTEFDFTRAFIPEEDTPITVNGWIGDVKMLIPKHVPFRAEAFIKTGDITIARENTGGMGRQLVYESEDYELAKRRLTIYIDLKIGQIQIDHV